MSRWSFELVCEILVWVCLSFPAPTSSTDLNSNNDKTYKFTPIIESLWTMQIAFFRFAMPSGFPRGGRDKVQKVFVQESVQEKIIWNHLWEHRSSVPDPCVFPPPGGHFSAQTTTKPNLWLDLPGSPVTKHELNYIKMIWLWVLLYISWFLLPGTWSPDLLDYAQACFKHYATT